MKKVILPEATFSVTTKDGIKEVPAAEQLKILLLTLPPKDQRAFTIEEMRLRIPVIDKLEKAKKELLLEKEEHELLVSIMENVTWGGVNRNAVELADAIVNAEDVEVQEKKKS